MVRLVSEERRAASPVTQHVHPREVITAVFFIVDLELKMTKKNITNVIKKQTNPVGKIAQKEVCSFRGLEGVLQTVLLAILPTENNFILDRLVIYVILYF